MTQRAAGGYLQALVHANSSRAGVVTVGLSGAALTVRTTGAGPVSFTVSSVGGRHGGATQTFAVGANAGQPLVIPTGQFAVPSDSVLVRVGSGRDVATRRVAAAHPALATVVGLGVASRKAKTSTVTSAAAALSAVARGASARVTVSVYRGRTLVASATRVCMTSCSRAVGVSVAWRGPHGLYRTLVTVVVRRGTSAVGLVASQRAANFRN